MLYKKLDNSQPMSHHVDDASSALYINDPQKRGFLKKTILYSSAYFRTN